MTRRKIVKTVTGKHAVDGAGVHLVRVLGHDDVHDFDPFLMLDSFDSKNPEDYTAGFPMHPHRGIETITYLIRGKIEHQDSLGNKGDILSGQSQWMTAGSGIMHQEMPKASDHMLGLQIWLNLPQSEKMATPAYFDITQKQIPAVDVEQGTVRVISGEYRGAKGVHPRHIQATLYDVSVDENREIILPVKEEETVFVFLIEGDALIDETAIAVKTAVLFGPGDEIAVKAPAGSASRFVFFSGKPLHEPIAWGGPIVMNTQEELRQAFSELQNGRFIRENALR